MKTKSQLQNEFSELTGRDATAANAYREITLLNLNLDFRNLKASSTEWWDILLNGMWQHIKSR